MFSEIANILGYHALGMILVFVLFILLFDKEAINRVNSKPSIKRSGYITIVIYYISIIIEIIQKLMKR
jgi:predicted membrane channel-forming protein YqfA (hemolysin III family)